MAEPDDLDLKPSGDPSITCKRVDPGQQSRALSVLLTGRPEAAVPSTVGFLETVEAQQMSLDELWAAYRDGEPQAAMLILPNPGRTAMSFISPIRDPRHTPVMQQLVRTACENQDRRRVSLVQALLDDHHQQEARALISGGFMELAYLRYMSRDLGGPDTEFSSTEGLDHGLKVLTWSQTDRTMFAAAIEASYEDTLDCPRLVGLREIDDIIDGHQSTGRFMAGLWFVVVDGDQPAAVMLLNPVPQSRAVELVYLGVSPRWRRQGLGKRLLTQGLAASARHGADQILLAVDEANTPALKLYRRMRFAPKARKLALIFVLPANERR